MNQLMKSVEVELAIINELSDELGIFKNLLIFKGIL
jgi:hypothetical protein